MQTSQHATRTPLTLNPPLPELPEELLLSTFPPSEPPCIYSYERPYQPIQSLQTEVPQTFPFMTPWPIPSINFDDIQDVISRGIISFDKAEESLRVFQSSTRFFPFVAVPPRTSLDSLRREKPFLLLSILTLGAKKDFKFQQALELELRKSLSENIMLKGKKSLDLLQSVLVYLGW